jgi:tRNA modification GTPase
MGPGGEDTIVAVSSPPGSALRAVVRLSGGRAVEIGGAIRGAAVLPGPRTYTREDIVEIHVPGAPPLVEALVRDLVARGARPARPGEFTLRAFLNGRLDLAQAEAVERLVSSDDDAERRGALEQLDGAFSRRVRELESGLLDLAADSEAAIDFVDQDVDILPVPEAVRRAAALRDGLRRLLEVTAARRVTDTRPVVVLYGPPNSGKSSLFNVLTGSRAIVAPVPGTTRDALAADLDVGVRVRLMDTPGDQMTQGLDHEAVRRGRRTADSADLVLLVVDAADGKPALAIPRPGPASLLVVNKCDLAPADDALRAFPELEAVCVSAQTGEGLPRLKAAIARRVAESPGEGPAARFRVDTRQRGLLCEAERALDRAAGGAIDLGMEFVALDLRVALEALGGITGRHVSEDLLDRIFSRFCLGK